MFKSWSEGTDQPTIHFSRKTFIYRKTYIPPLLERDITNLFSFKPFICEAYSSDDQGNITLGFESHQDTSSLSCPICNGKVHIHDTYISTLKDMPFLPDGTQKIKVLTHRYKWGL